MKSVRAVADRPVKFLSWALPTIACGLVVCFCALAGAFAFGALGQLMGGPLVTVILALTGMALGTGAGLYGFIAIPKLDRAPLIFVPGTPSFVARTRLSWQEPEEVRQTRLALAARSRHFGPCGLIAAIGVGLFGFVLHWIVAGGIWNRGPLISAALVTILTKVGITAIIAVMIKTSRSHIVLSKLGIFLDDPQGRVFWMYRDLLAFRIVVAGQDRLLEVTGANGHAYVLGIASSVSLEEMGAVLAESGVSITKQELPGGADR